MLRLTVIAIGALALVLAATVGGFFLYGPERLWANVAGPADQGPVDFARLSRSPTPNDALACSPGGCPSGDVDLALPVYPSAPADLMGLLDRTIGGDASVERVDDGSQATRRRYVVRTPLMRFPDTVNAEATSIAGGTALRLYSRSLLGRGDFGANLARLRSWAAMIGAAT